MRNYMYTDDTKCGATRMRLRFYLLLTALCLHCSLVQVDALLLCQLHQELLHSFVLLHQIPYFSGELLCLTLDLFNGRWKGGGRKKRKDAIVFVKQPQSHYATAIRSLIILYSPRRHSHCMSHIFITLITYSVNLVQFAINAHVILTIHTCIH